MISFERTTLTIRTKKLSRGVMISALKITVQIDGQRGRRNKFYDLRGVDGRVHDAVLDEATCRRDEGLRRRCRRDQSW